MRNNVKVTSRMIAAEVEARMQCRACLSSIEKVHYRLNKELYPFGRSRQALTPTWKLHDGHAEYIKSTVDERIFDNGRPTQDKVSVP